MLRKRLLLALLSLPVGLVALYLLGPRPAPFHPHGELPVLTGSPVTIAEEVRRAEEQVPHLKPDNEARVIWANPDQPGRTTVSLVYLHGFGASQAEGAPVHTALAKRYGFNLYLARLEGHGLGGDAPFLGLTPDAYLQSAREAVAIGQALGDRVVLMGSSTGASLALALASQNPAIAGVLAYAPLVDTADGTLFLARGPWGRQLVSLIRGNPVVTERPDPLDRYWSRIYHPDAYVSLSQLIGATMRPEVFAAIRCPVFIGYYFKSEAEQDTVVSVPRIRELFSQLGTPPDQKRQIAFPLAGDHVIASHLRSGDWKGVLRESDRFLREVLPFHPLAEGEAP